MEQKNKKWWIAGAIGAAFLGAALLWYSLSEPEEETISDEEILEKLKDQKLDKVQLDPNGQINYQYFLKLLQFIGAQTRENTKELKKQEITERRELYKAGNESAYQDKVREMIMSEEQALSKTLKRVTEVLNIPQEQFEGTHQRLANNPQTAEYVMAATQGKLEKGAPLKEPTLSKEEVKDYLEKSQRSTSEAMQDMQKQQSDMQNMAGDPMEMMVKMMVQQAKMQDKLYEQTDIEHDDFEENLMYWMTHDKEIAMKMQQYMMQMRMQMGGQ